MNVTETSISGVKIVEPDVFGDSRGWFCEQYNAARYKAAGITADFVQDNESFSSKGVVRGLHNLYCKGSERGLMFNDPALGIEWPLLDVPILLSAKDQLHPPLSAIEPWVANPC